MRLKGITSPCSEANVREPAIIAMLGPAGAGKSTWITRHAAYLQSVSLDAGRAIFSPYRCVCDQAPLVTAAAVEFAVATARNVLHTGQSVVWDATNADPAARALITVLAAEHSARSIAVVLLPPLDVVQGRNATRSAERHLCGFTRRVPSHVVAAMHGEIKAAVPTLAATWDEVVVADYADHRTCAEEDREVRL